MSRIQLGSRSLAVKLGVAATVLLSAPRLLAGTTSSGGGELIRDGDNPWFLENTASVNYCINIDEGNFHRTHDEVAAMIQKALAYWKDQFSKAEYPAYGFGPGPTPFTEVKVATQTFSEVSCLRSADIQFQFGVLGQSQAARLGNPRDFIAAAIRDSYDFSNMRAAGFIYVAPESGPLAPTASTVIQNPWQQNDGDRLYNVLLHELGHVFGLQHGGDRTSLMGAGFPEFMVSADADDYFNRVNGTLDFFKYSGIEETPFGIGGSSLPASIVQFWGLTASYMGIMTRIHGDQIDILVTTSAGAAPSDWAVFGTIGLEPARTSQQEEAVTVFLPDGQQVFDAATYGHYLSSAAKVIMNRRGTYASADGKTQRQVFVTIKPDLSDFRIGGIYNGEVIMDAFATSDIPTNPRTGKLALRLVGSDVH